MGEIILEGKFLTTSGYQLLWHHKDQKQTLEEALPEVFLYGEKSL